MKRIMLLVLTTLMIVLLLGCNAENAKLSEEEMNTEEKTEPVAEDMNNANETEVKLVTKEQIMEYYGFSESELEGIHVDEIIKKYKVTEEDFKDFTKESFLECLKFFDEDIKTDIGYLFKGGQPDGKIPVSQIKTVALLKGDDAKNYYRQIRVREKKAYFCIGYTDNMDLEERAERSGAITDEYIAELLNCLEKANLHIWKAKYKGNNGNADGSEGWVLGIELIDGTVYTWRGSGMFGDNKPKEYQSVENAVKAVHDKCRLVLNKNHS